MHLHPSSICATVVIHNRTKGERIMPTKSTKAASRLDAKAKGAQTTALAKLEPVAKEINHRLSRASKMEDDATDHRLAAALQLANAKQQCREAKIKFQEWCEAHVLLQTYSTVRRLATIGEAGAEQGQKMLDDMRGKNAESNRAARGREKIEKTARAVAAQETPSSMLSKALSAMKEPQALKSLSQAASTLGHALVGEAEAQAARKAAEVVKYGPVEQIKALFAAATPSEKMAVVNHMVKAVGATIIMDEPVATNGRDDDLLAIPDNLRRAVPARTGGRRKATTA